MNTASGRPSILTWLSPGFWVEQKIREGRLADAVFDVGPGGITGWYGSMQREFSEGVRRGGGAVSALFALSSISGIFVYLRTGIYSLELVVAAAAIVIPIGLLLKAIWHFGAATAYARAWRALEDEGVQWHLENGSWFRLTFKRSDGSYRLDPTTRADRLNAEISTVARRASNIRGQFGSLLSTVAIGAVIYAAVAFGLRYFNWTAPISGQVACVLSAWFLGTILPSSVSYLVQTLWEKADYEKAYQYIPNPKVIDPVHDPMTREKVQSHKTFEDSNFVEPNDASARLGS